MLKYCSIGSGSSGNCHVVSYKDTGILIDAGLAGKRTDEPGHGEKWDRIQAENAAVCGRQDHAAGKKLQQGADFILCKHVRGYRRSGENRTAG